MGVVGGLLNPAGDLFHGSGRLFQRCGLRLGAFRQVFTGLRDLVGHLTDFGGADFDLPEGGFNVGQGIVNGHLHGVHFALVFALHPAGQVAVAHQAKDAAEVLHQCGKGIQ